MSTASTEGVLQATAAIIPTIYSAQSVADDASEILGDIQDVSDESVQHLGIRTYL